MDEFISFVRTKEAEPKKSRPMGWPSAALRASVWTGHGELAIAQTCTVLIRPRLPVLDNPKGDGRSKTKDQRQKIRSRMVNLYFYITYDSIY